MQLVTWSDLRKKKKKLFLYLKETKKKENCQVWYLKHVREIYFSIPSPLFRRGFSRKTVSNGSKTRKRRKNGRIEKRLGQRRLNKGSADRENKSKREIREKSCAREEISLSLHRSVR